MVLKAPNDGKLQDYYDNGGNHDYTGDCNQSNRTKWWLFTPYNAEETKYWLLKMLALPLGASLIFIFVFQIGFGSINNQIIEWISYLLIFVGNIFLTSYIRELMRAQANKIRFTDGLIDEHVNPDGKITVVDDAFTYELNKIDPVKYTIGFLGDIMMMRKHVLEAKQNVKDFFNEAKFVVGNLEGIVREKCNRLTTQAHKPVILSQLQGLLNPNTQWLLCLSNNHSIDFGNDEFHNSLHKINASPNTCVFGRNDVPYTYFQNPLAQDQETQDLKCNISTATQWSNQHNWDCITLYEDRDDHNGIRAHHLGDSFNILYPHWGFENERYVRRRIQLDARTLLTGQQQTYPSGLPAIVTPDPNHCWDLIFGHHPHVRQPIMKVQTKTSTDVLFYRLVVFSSGNFTSGANIIRKKKHIFGTIMTCEIGPLIDDANQWAIGKIRWQRTVNKRTKPGGVKTKTIEIDEGDYPSSTRTSLYFAIAILALTLLVRILERFFF
jgi:hypothetical protein